MTNYFLVSRMDELVKQFYLWQPIDLSWLNATLSKQLEHDTDLQQFQTELLSRTVKSKIFSKFPTHTGSCSSFFKKLVVVFEKLGIETVLDEFYETSVPVQKLDEAGNHFYKSYFDTGGRIHYCSLIETKEFVSRGTTGLQTWPAAEFLFEHLKCHLTNQTVLELGSGIGYLGISSLNHSSKTKWIFTDHSEAVLDNLRENLALNNIGQDKYLVTHLDWSQPPPKTEVFNQDIIVASDVVFDQRIIPDLCRCITRLLSKGQRAIIANVERNEKTKESFEQTLIHSGLKFHLQRSKNMLLYDIEMQKSAAVY